MTAPTSNVRAAIQRLDDTYCQRDLLKAERDHLLDSILTDEQRAAITEIHAEFDPKIESADGVIKTLEQQVKDLVAEHGATVKTDTLMVTYGKGRVTWDTAKLDGMAALIPQLNEARKIGQPVISIRRVQQ